MKKFKRLFSLVPGFLLVQLFVTVAYAGDKKFQVGIQLGPFIPQDYMVQGSSQITYSGSALQYAVVNGFGYGNDLNLSVVYYFSDWGINLKSGARLLKNKLEVALPPNGDKDYFENTLTIIPVTLSLIDRLKLSDSKFVPYIGMGAGVLIAHWEEKHYPENQTRLWLKGSANPVDFHFLAGFTFPIYYDLLFNGEIEYSYAPADWKIKNVDTTDEVEMKNLNIGGVALKLGLAFRF